MMKKTEHLNANGPVPLYKQIKDRITQQIIEHSLKPHERIPSTSEICKLFNVSSITAVQVFRSLAANNLVYSVHGKGTFVSPYASDTKNAMGLIMSLDPCMGWQEAIMAIDNKLCDHGCKMIRQFYETERECHDLIMKYSGETTGMIIYLNIRKSSNCDFSFLDDLRRKNIHFVLMDIYFDGKKFDYVTTDNRKGAYMAMQHLIDSGHRRIGLVTGRLFKSSYRDKQEGYKDALIKNNIEFDKDLVKIIDSYDIKPVEDAVNELLDLRERPTGIFAASYNNTLIVKNTIEGKKMVIPKDISLIGYDDVPENFPYRIADLTTIRQNKTLIGEKAAEILFSKIGGDNHENPHQIFIEPELVIGSTTHRINRKPQKNVKKF